MIRFNVNTIITCTEAEGPFKRLAIWFQGCNINCKGCFNPDCQPIVAKNIISIDELLEIIQSAKSSYEIEGVTYLGGEPTLQLNLPDLTRLIKSLGLGVIAFTGRRYREVASILSGCDVVIDGTFEINRIDTYRRIIGSVNQNVLHLTDRYPNIDAWFKKKTKYSEISIGSAVVINGETF